MSPVLPENYFKSSIEYFRERYHYSHFAQNVTRRHLALEFRFSIKSAKPLILNLYRICLMSPEV